MGFGRDQFSREFETEITGGQCALLGGRACPEVAFLRELKGNCVSFCARGGFWQRTVFTGEQSALLGGRACPEVAFLREFEEICVSLW